MRTLGDSLKKAFSPTVAVHVEDLGDSKLAKTVLLEIYENKRIKCNVLLDHEKNVIYLNRKKKGGNH